MRNQDVSIESVTNEYSLLVYFVENIEFFMWPLGIIAIGFTTLRYFTFKNTALILNKDDYLEIKAKVGGFEASDKTFCSKCDDFSNHLEESYSPAAKIFLKPKIDTFCINCHPSLWENWCMFSNDRKARWELKGRRNWVFLMCVFFGIMLLANSEDSVVLAIFFK